MPCLRNASRICGTAAAASSRSTVMRTISEPARERAADLGHRAFDVGGVGIGHRLHDDRRAAADGDIADHGPGWFCAGHRGPATSL